MLQPINRWLERVVGPLSRSPTHLWALSPELAARVRRPRPPRGPRHLDAARGHERVRPRASTPATVSTAARSPSACGAERRLGGRVPARAQQVAHAEDQHRAPALVLRDRRGAERGRLRRRHGLDAARHGHELPDRAAGRRSAPDPPDHDARAHARAHVPRGRRDVAARRDAHGTLVSEGQPVDGRSCAADSGREITGPLVFERKGRTGTSDMLTMPSIVSRHVRIEIVSRGTDRVVRRATHGPHIRTALPPAARGSAWTLASANCWMEGDLALTAWGTPVVGYRDPHRPPHDRELRRGRVGAGRGARPRLSDRRAFGHEPAARARHGRTRAPAVHAALRERSRRALAGRSRRVARVDARPAAPHPPGRADRGGARRQLLRRVRRRRRRSRGEARRGRHVDGVRRRDRGTSPRSVSLALDASGRPWVAFVDGAPGAAREAIRVLEPVAGAWKERAFEGRFSNT